MFGGHKFSTIPESLRDLQLKAITKISPINTQWTQSFHWIPEKYYFIKKFFPWRAFDLPRQGVEAATKRLDPPSGTFIPQPCKVSANALSINTYHFLTKWQNTFPIYPWNYTSIHLDRYWLSLMGLIHWHFLRNIRK